MLFERLSEETLAAYERCYFEKVCKISAGRRRTFSTPLSQIEGLHFACVQDTVERLIETEHGRLSTFQWRNFIFAPIDRNVNERDVFMQVFDELRKALPSIFIRSYVYLVFIKVYGAGSLSLFGHDLTPNVKDFQTYYWNTNYEIERIAPSRLATIGIPQREAKRAEKGKPRKRVERVFIVSDPYAELKRIQDANSDVIDAVKAFTGNLGLYKETADVFGEIETTLKKPGARVLLEGPARSGKTVIAMSLLASDHHAKMLLMNWYFYDALKDAFKIWTKQDEKDIARLFEPSQELLGEIEYQEADLAVLKANEINPCFIDALIKMWCNPPIPADLSGWTKRPTGDGGEEWLITRCQGMRAGDLVCVWQNSSKVAQLHIIEAILNDGLARPSRLFDTGNLYNNRPINNEPGSFDEGRLTPEEILKRLERLRSLIAAEGLAATIAKKVKATADALDSSEQRFFHHDRDYPEGLWVHGRTKLISDYCTLVCDEAQRLGTYGNLDEVAWVRRREGSTFLCGDDNQRLNKRGDKGLSPVIEGKGFEVYHLPEAVGIPTEVELLVKAMLDEGEVPVAPKSFSIKLLYKDDLGLVEEFNRDPHGKKHYAMPMSTSFYTGGYMPCIMRSRERTDRCTDECDAIPYGLCRHRYILPLSPLSDRKGMPKRTDLSRRYKFFCAEAIMPEYALSAYELISREVESIYLKIPWKITPETLKAPMDGDDTNSWIKRHLYVLMTRATANLVINIENKQLYESFRRICMNAGVC